MCVCLCVCFVYGDRSPLMVDPRNVVTSLIGFSQLSVVTYYNSTHTLKVGQKQDLAEVQI